MTQILTTAADGRLSLLTIPADAYTSTTDVCVWMIPPRIAPSRQHPVARKWELHTPSRGLQRLLHTDVNACRRWPLFIAEDEALLYGLHDSPTRF